MGELQMLVDKVANDTVRLTGIAQEIEKHNKLLDALDELRRAIDKTEKSLPVAQALGATNESLMTSIESLRSAVESVRMSISALPSDEIPEGAIFVPIAAQLASLEVDLRSASRDAWQAFVDRHLSPGVFALLAAAARIGNQRAEVLWPVLRNAHSWPIVKSVEDLDATRAKVKEFQEIRAELSGGDEQLEKFLVALTGKGVALQQLLEYEEGRKWLDKYKIGDQLFVTMMES
jgi:hypothetical protein